MFTSAKWSLRNLDAIAETAMEKTESQQRRFVRLTVFDLAISTIELTATMLILMLSLIAKKHRKAAS